MRPIAWLRTLWTGTSYLTIETTWMHYWGEAAEALPLGYLRGTAVICSAFKTSSGDLSPTVEALTIQQVMATATEV